MKKTPGQIARDNESACIELNAIKDHLNMLLEEKMIAKSKGKKALNLCKERIAKKYDVNIEFIEKIINS